MPLQPLTPPAAPGPRTRCPSPQEAMQEDCDRNGECFTIKANKTRFCEEMHAGTMYPGVS